MSGHKPWKGLFPEGYEYTEAYQNARKQIKREILVWRLTGFDLMDRRWRPLRRLRDIVEGKW